VAQRILIVEDDRLFNETLCDFLTEKGYACSGVFDAKSALERCYRERFDLYLLDINLPMQSGLELLKSLRECGDETPTIFLTSREDRKSLILGLSYGADDYLRKPVDMEELSLRIRAMLRRIHGPESYRIDDYEVDLARRKLYRNGREIEIGRKVFDLLALLLKAQGKVVTTETITTTLWTTAEEASYGAIRVYITQLKKHFGHRVENIRGVGYRLVNDER
jgi:DNA-binding response OmpR family regulator